MRFALPLALLGALVACKPVEKVAEAASDSARDIAVARGEKELVQSMAALRDVAARAESVTLYRIAHDLDPNYAEIAKNAKEKVSGYPVLAKIATTKEEVAPLVAVLTVRGSYFPAGDGWSCIFEPHHILEVKAAGKTVRAIICISCGDVTFEVDEKKAGGASVLPPADAKLTEFLSAPFKA